MVYYAYSGWGHFRPLDTRSYSGEATDIKDTVLCFHSSMFHVPSFSKRDDFAQSPLKSSWYLPLALTTYRGMLFFFSHFSSLFLLCNSCTCYWGFCRKHGKVTDKPFPRRINVSRASYCYAPIQIKPNRVKALALRGIMVQ